MCFVSFYGLYNDNPRYIAEKLHEINPDVEIIWCINKKKSNMIDIPKYAKVIKMGSLKKLFYQNTSCVIVDNLAGWYSGVALKKDKESYKSLINRKTLNISTWHGTPKKKIGVDAYDSSEYRFSSTTEFLCAASEYEKKIFKNSFIGVENIIKVGMPRNDLLVNISDAKKNDIKKKFGIESDKKVVLYAPTYRDEKESNFYMNDYTYGLDIKRLIGNLKEKFGGDWVFIFRGHQFDQSKSSFVEFCRQLDTEIIDGNIYDDMAEYLSVSDVLITDYSGSLFDFALTKRPCFLYTPDLEHYFNSERGVYSVEVPYEYNITNDQLEECINGFEKGIYERKLMAFNKNIGAITDGKSSERIALAINRYIITGDFCFEHKDN